MTEIQQALERAMPAIAQDTKNALKAVAPFLTGHLKRTLKVVAVPGGLDMFFVDYAKYVEFGVPVKTDGPIPNFPNYGHRPNPFIRTTLFQKLGKIIQFRLNEELNR